MISESAEMDLKDEAANRASQEKLAQLRAAFEKSGQKGYLRKKLNLSDDPDVILPNPILLNGAFRAGEHRPWSDSQIVNRTKWTESSRIAQFTFQPCRSVRTRLPGIFSTVKN